MLGGANERVVLFASVLFSTLSLGSNLWGGMATEKKRAELALEVRGIQASGPRLYTYTPLCARAMVALVCDDAVLP